MATPEKPAPAAVEEEVLTIVRDKKGRAAWALRRELCGDGSVEIYSLRKCSYTSARDLLMALAMRGQQEVQTVHKLVISPEIRVHEKDFHTSAQDH